MFTKLFSSTAGSAVVLTFIGLAAAHPLGIANEPLVARDAASVVLQPMTNWGGIGASPNAQLHDYDNFYWSNGNVLANLSCSGGADYKMLNVARMGDHVQKLDCSNPKKLTMTFKDKAAMKSVQADWDWVRNKKKNTMVLVVDGGECGGSNGRAQYAVSTVRYDDNCLTATMHGKPTAWTDFVKDYTLHVKSNALEQNSINNNKLTKRIGGSGSIDLGHDFSTKLFDKDIDGINLEVDCAHCATTGSLDFDFVLSIIDGITGSITTKNGLGASVGLGVTASGQLTQPVDLGSLSLLSIPLTPIEIPKVATFGPEITIGATAGISSISGEITADFGVAMVIPDGTTLRIGGDSDSINPQFNKIGPNLSASVQVTASLAPVITFDIAATVFGLGLVAGLGLEAPKLDATLSAEASTSGGICGDSNVDVGVELEVDVGVELNIFGGFGKASDQPNAKSIFSTSTPVFNDCFPITSGGTETGPSSGNSLPINGNDGNRPKVGTVVYTDFSKADLFNNGAASDDTPINPLSDTQGILNVNIDGDVGLASCDIFPAIDPTNGCQGDVIVTITAGTAFDIPDEDAQNILCMRCANSQ